MGNVNLLPGQVTDIKNGRADIVIAGVLHTSGAIPGGLSNGARLDVAVRPENVILSPTPNEGAPQAEITEHVFLGNINEYQVKLGDHSLRVQTHPKDSYTVGTKVGIAVDPEAISVFAHTE
jgi:ABC-type Fe3+/spermidine/putrescine transport system ATPase subunit